MKKEDLIKRQSKIRNFSIIAHIDHGKSTLADRILELTKTVEKRDMQAQLLDSMDLERERGITIKLNAVELNYTAKDGEEYIFHLIDTPGHVDFAYEVSRSLAACEGALLVVDAAQGIEAQTLANVYLALDNDLEILPVINKIDLPSADPDHVIEEIENVIGLPAKDAPRISAKTGLNIEDVLELIVNEVPAPKGDIDAPLQALIFDSYYDKYRGVIPSVRVVNGIIKKGDIIKMVNTNAEFLVTEVGVNTPNETPREYLMPGDVGYIVAQIKSIKDIRVGDTITSKDNPCEKALDGYKNLTPMVYCGLYPTDAAKYDDLKEALEKLQLNDASLTFEPETSQALGFGFRAGFLGMLHMEIVQERIDREFNIDMIATAPSVIYKVNKIKGDSVYIDNPSQLPEQKFISTIEEPYVKTSIMTPNEYVGTIMKLCQYKRGIYVNTTYIDATRVALEYEMPLSEIIYDFFDKPKSSTKGYASFDYDLIGYRVSNLVKMDILLNKEIIDALSVIVHKDFATVRGHAITVKLKTLIPRQQFEIPIQAAIGSKVISRTNIQALRKDVLAKCYGGDITRKKKLLNKQKEGKKRMKQVGSVEVPQEAFMAILNVDDE